MKDSEYIETVNKSRSVRIKEFKKHTRVYLVLEKHTETWNLRGKLADLPEDLKNAILTKTKESEQL